MIHLHTKWHKRDKRIIFDGIGIVVMAKVIPLKKRKMHSKHIRASVSFRENGNSEGRTLQEHVELIPKGQKATLTFQGKSYKRLG